MHFIKLDILFSSTDVNMSVTYFYFLKQISENVNLAVEGIWGCLSLRAVAKSLEFPNTLCGRYKLKHIPNKHRLKTTFSEYEEKEPISVLLVPLEKVSH
jgi:hypothetical protein